MTTAAMKAAEGSTAAVFDHRNCSGINAATNAANATARPSPNSSAVVQNTTQTSAAATRLLIPEGHFVVRSNDPIRQAQEVRIAVGLFVVFAPVTSEDAVFNGPLVTHLREAKVAEVLPDVLIICSS